MKQQVEQCFSEVNDLEILKIHLIYLREEPRALNATFPRLPFD